MLTYPPMDARVSPAATDDLRVRRLLDAQRRVLDRLASGAPLEDVLQTLVVLIEEQTRGTACAVLLANAGQTRLTLAAARGLPRDFRIALEPCKKPVYSRVAGPQGIRAIWSTPILSDANRVLGIFAMFSREPRLPDEDDLRLIEMAVQMARVAIEGKTDDDLLRTIFDQALTPLFVSDMDHRIVRANKAFASALGYSPADLRGKPLAAISEGADPAAIAAELRHEAHVVSDRRYRHGDGRTLWARERSSARLDESGAPRYVVTRVDHLSDADPLAALSRREREVLQLVVASHTSKQIAARLGIAPASVDSYRSRLMLKLGVGDLAALVRFAIRHRLASA